jgi:hypothetical protein
MPPAELHYKGHTISLRRTTKGGVPRWVACARVSTPYGPLTLAAVVGEDVLVKTHEKMRELAAKFRDRITDGDGADQVSGVDTWGEIVGWYDEVGANAAFKATARQIDQVVNDPTLQAVASLIPFVNIAAKAAGVAAKAVRGGAEGGALGAQQAAADALGVQPARIVIQRPPGGGPARLVVRPAVVQPAPAPTVFVSPAPTPATSMSIQPMPARRRPSLPALPPKVAAATALLGRAQAGDKQSLALLRGIRAAAKEGQASARAGWLLLEKLRAAGVPALSKDAASMVRNTVPITVPAVVVEEDDERDEEPEGGEDGETFTVSGGPIIKHEGAFA